MMRKTRRSATRSESKRTS